MLSLLELLKGSQLILAILIGCSEPIRFVLTNRPNMALENSELIESVLRVTGKLRVKFCLAFDKNLSRKPLLRSLSLGRICIVSPDATTDPSRGAINHKPQLALTSP